MSAGPIPSATLDAVRARLLLFETALRAESRPERQVSADLIAHAARSVALARTATEENSEIEMLAWATRRLFEILVTLRYVLAKPERYFDLKYTAFYEQTALAEDLAGIGSQLGVDPAEFLRQHKEGEPEIEALRARFEQDSKGGHKVVRVPRSYQRLAQEVGLGDEHARFYSLLSKLTHPSPWVIGAPMGPLAQVLRSVLEARAQLYGLDLIAVLTTPGLAAEKRFDENLGRWLGP